MKLIKLYNLIETSEIKYLFFKNKKDNRKKSRMKSKEWINNNQDNQDDLNDITR